MKLRFPAFLLLLCFVSACAPTLKMEQTLNRECKLKEDDFPRQVAILPFENATNQVGLDQLVRRTFANHFSSKSYQDMKLPVVDEKVVQYEKSSGKRLLEASPREISAIVGSDGILFGRVTDYTRIYAAVYSQFGMEAEVWMLNARTGKEIFRLKESVRYHEGGIPTNPLSAVVTVVSTAMNLREIQKVRLVNELAYRFMEKIPAPTATAAYSRPVIKDVLSNASEGPFGPRRLVKAAMEGEPGLVATFDIGNFRKGIAMKEIKPGIYSGEYAVLPGDTTRDMPVTVTLTRPGGQENTWTDVNGFITIDTLPPAAVSGLKAKPLKDRIELSWSPVAGVPDLKGYKVLRSSQPISGYAEVALVEEPAFSDRSAQAGASYYYRVVPVDRAGNEAEGGEPVRAGLPSTGVVELSGRLPADTTLDGEYLVKTDLMVPSGITLTIADGTKIKFNAGTGLLVYGKLVVPGSESGVEFAPARQVAWSGVTIDGGRIDVRRIRVSGASVGIDMRNVEGAIDGSIITGGETGIAIRGMTAVSVKGCTIVEANTGVRLNATGAAVTGCEISRNRVGVDVDGYTGDFRDNSLLGNDINIRSKAPAKIAVNYFGTILADELRVENVAVEQVYDAKPPTGKAVALVVDPYRKLSPEERKRRGTELVTQAGESFRRSNYGKASALFSEAVRVDPTAETYYYLGICHQEMQESDKAIALLKEGTAKFPSDPLLWKSLGLLSSEKGDTETARRALTEALRLSPGDRQAKFLLERLPAK